MSSSSVDAFVVSVGLAHKLFWWWVQSATVRSRELSAAWVVCVKRCLELEKEMIWVPGLFWSALCGPSRSQSVPFRGTHVFPCSPGLGPLPVGGLHADRVESSHRAHRASQPLSHAWKTRPLGHSLSCRYDWGCVGFFWSLLPSVCWEENEYAIIAR